MLVWSVFSFCVGRQEEFIICNPFSSGLEIVYTQFYRWATALCPGIGEFHCDNARCIKVGLQFSSLNIKA